MQIIYLPELAPLFNSSLGSGVMPTVWKSATITPVRKGDNRELVENYKCQRETPLLDGRRMVVLAIIIKPLPQKNGNSTIWWLTPTRSWHYGRAVETIQRRSGPSPPRISLVHGYGQLDLQMVSRSSRTSHRAFPGKVKKGIGWRRCHCRVCHSRP